MSKYKNSIQVIPENDNPLFIEREVGLVQSSFKIELLTLNCIKNGDVEFMEKLIEKYLSEGLVMGRLSHNELRQIQYWAICSIATSTHYSVLGGYDETLAANLSDVYIIKIDSLKKIDDVMDCFVDFVRVLTKEVQKSAHLAKCPFAVRTCLHYININLHNKITLQELANHVNLSCDYLSVLFKKAVGSSLKYYILSQKLQSSKLLLLEGYTISQTAYLYSFCSESHFISSFKKVFQITPKQFLNSVGK